MISCIILGAGGHASGVIEAMQLEGKYKPIFSLDPRPFLRGKRVNGVLVKGGDELLDRFSNQNFIVGVGGIGNNNPREEVFMRAFFHGLTPVTVIHPTASVSKFAKIGQGSVVMANAVVGAGAWIGNNVIINTGAIVEHGCIVGDHAHVATGARLCGDVVLDDLVHVGAGAVVKQGLRIREGAVIGCGAVVVKNVPEKQVWVGNPAKRIRK